MYGVKWSYFDINKISEKEWGYLVGFFIGDGYIRKGRIIVLALSDRDVEKGVCAKLTQIISKSGKRSWIYKKKNRSIQLTVASKDLAAHLKSIISFEDGNKSKTVSLNSLHHSTEFLKGLIGGLIDSDGNADRVAYFSTISGKLFHQIQKVSNHLKIRTGCYEHFTPKGNKAYNIWFRNRDVKKIPLPSIKLQKASWFHNRRREDLWILDVVKEMPDKFRFSDVVKKTGDKSNLIWILLNHRLIKRGYLRKVSRGVYKKTSKCKKIS
ncbi:MAG: hypothetical protein QMD14_04020 [Candidatus Aenigmarchaeota archaeon]|nr:hypothetical protein [Candidatus Aenigmarchaeota archaeon]